MITLKTTQTWLDGADRQIKADQWFKLRDLGVRDRDAQVTDLITRVRYMMDENHEATIDTPITEQEDDVGTLVDDEVEDDEAGLEVLPVDSEDTRDEPNAEVVSQEGWDYVEVELY